MGATMIQESHFVEDDVEGHRFEITLDGGESWRRVSQHEYLHLLEVCVLHPDQTGCDFGGFYAAGGKVAGRMS